MSQRKSSNKLDSEVFLGVIAIVITIIAFIILFGAFDKAGKEGGIIFEGLYTTIGIFAYTVPFILLYSAYLLWRSRFPSLNIYKVLGFLFIAIAIFGGLALVDPAFAGVLGTVTVVPLVAAIGLIPTIISFIAVCYAGLMIIVGRKHLFDLSGFSFSLPTFALPKLSLNRREKNTTAEEVEAEQEEYQDEENEEDESSNIRDELFGKNKKKEDPLESGLFDNTKEEEFETKTKTPRLDPEFIAPPLDLLSEDSGKATAGDTIAKMKAIKSTLDTFNIPVEMGNVTVGPTVTQFTLKPAQGVNVKRVLGLKDNLQMALSATNMHIEAPIPGKPFVGIEVPNDKKQQLGLGSMLSDGKFKNANNLTVAIGKDIIGNPVYGNIETMPHLLIAGATRSGKSVTVQNLIMSLLYKNSPADLKLMIIDPKRVEFTMYKNLPHLGTPVITEVKNAIKCLNWAIGEMERRYNYFADEHAGIQNIGDYNKKILFPAMEKARKAKKVDNLPEKLPYIVIVFDEFNDFMLSYPKEITVAITNLTQKGRAAGIHLILATQRPDVKVITGTIKANITARIALKTSSSIDSRTILDQTGAEDLLGNGDMLYMSTDHPRPVRVQAPFVSSEEVRAVIDYIKTAYRDYDSEKIDISKASLNINTSGSSSNDEGDDNSDGTEPLDDPDYVKAREYIIATGKASTTQLQSRFGWGYPKAAKFIMQLERFGVVGPSINNKQREVLIKPGGAAKDDEVDALDELV